MQILIADDDRFSLRILDRAMHEWGHVPRLAADGDEAWECLAQASTPMLAILDWVMPRMSGVELCRQLRAWPNAARHYIIILTSRDSHADLAQCLHAGANDYVSKPFDPDELRARVGVGLRMLALQEELAERVRQLEDALAHVRTLQGLIPICMYCHRIRDEGDAWEQLETYISEHSEALFSHGICPACMQEHHPDVCITS